MRKKQELSPVQQERVNELTVEALDRVLRGIAEKRVEAKQNREWHYLVEAEFERLREMAGESVRNALVDKKSEKELERDEDIARGMAVLGEDADETIRKLGRRHRQKGPR